MEDNVVKSDENTTITDVLHPTGIGEPMDAYVRHVEFAEVKRDVKEIKDNHLPHILREIANLRWFIIGGAGVIAIVLTILQVFG